MIFFYKFRSQLFLSLLIFCNPRNNTQSINLLSSPMSDGIDNIVDFFKTSSYKKIVKPSISFKTRFPAPPLVCYISRESHKPTCLHLYIPGTSGCSLRCINQKHMVNTVILILFFSSQWLANFKLIPAVR